LLVFGVENGSVQNPVAGGPDDEFIAMLLESAAGFLAARHTLPRMKLGATLQGSVVDPALWREMGQLGWLGLRVPDHLGGTGLSTTHAGLLAESFGRAMLPEPFVMGGIFPATLLVGLPDSRPVRDLLEQLIAGTSMASVAWQERPGQCAPEPEATTWDGGRLRGRKCFVPNADTADVLLVSAATAAGSAILSVRADAADIERRLHRTGDGSLRADLDFDLPVDTCLANGPAASAALAHAVEETTMATAAYLAGLAAGMLDRILAHLNMRIQFGQPLAAFQTLRHRAVDLHIDCQLSRASWRRAAASWDAAPGAGRARAAISAAKARAGDAAMRCGRAGIQLHGGLGFAEEADLGLALRIALQHMSALGSPTQHRRRFLELEAAA
jgi:alkylation response protein AidB-like acyl-CoA dehydrogenase